MNVNVRESLHTFTAPLIRARGGLSVRRAAEGLLTTSLWGGWAYLLVAGIGAVWIPPFVHHLLPVHPPEHPMAVLLPIILCVVAGAAYVILVYQRAMHDRRRFNGADRRKNFMTSDDEVRATLSTLGEEEFARLRAARRIVIGHDDGGAVVRAAIVEAMPHSPASIP